MARIRPAKPCTARRTNGEPCKNYAMLGTTVCHAHGGKAPQTRQAARRRLEEVAVWQALAKVMTARDRRARALAPWVDDIRTARYLAGIQPAWTSSELRRIAAEMSATARDLRKEAKRLDGQ